MTEFIALDGRSHNTVGQAGWEAVADLALGWALDHAKPAPAAARATAHPVVAPPVALAPTAFARDLV